MIKSLANRIRALIGDEPNLSEKPMFGGLAYLVNGNMSVSASGKGGLLLRVPPEQTTALAKRPHANPFVMRDRPMEGWLRVEPAGVKTDKGLAPWVKLSVGFARSLPAKDEGKNKGQAERRPENAPAIKRRH